MLRAVDARSTISFVARLAADRFVAALLHLGCEKVTESDIHIVVCRGAVLLQTVPKVGMLSVHFQCMILARLSYSEQELLDALISVQ